MPAKGKGALRPKSQGQPGPSSKSRGSDGRRTKKKSERDQDMQPVKKKRKARASEETPSERIVMVTPDQRAKWKLLPESTRVYLESMMHWLAVSIIYESPQYQGEIEKHLNHLQERLLKCFKTLRAPVEKQSCLKNVKKLQAEEEEKIAATERGLAELEEAIDEAVEEAERRDKNISSLHREVEALKRELAEEEERMSQSSGKERDGVLALPKLPKDSLEIPVLQEQILKIPNQEGVLSDLNNIQRLEEMKAMLDSLEQAYDVIDKFKLKAYTVPKPRTRS